VTNSWNPPSGPPNGAPIRPADARREIDDVIAAARARDDELRAELSAVATTRVEATDRLAAADDEAAEATALAKRALTRSNESARAGQRADAAKWTAAAQVFAMRVRDARAQRTALEAQLEAAAERSRQVTQSLAQNVGRVQAVAAARLPVLSGRKAARLQREVDDVVVAISAPTAELVARATAAARAAAAAVAGDEPAVAPVEVDDLESELDIDSTDAILAELRDELGLPAAAGTSAPTPPSPPVPSVDAATGPPADAAPTSSETSGASGDSADTSSGTGAASDGGKGTGDDPGTPAPTGAGNGKPATAFGRTWPVPAARR